jgi:hypothetical protein
MIDRPLPEVAGQLRALSGATLLMPRAWYRGAYQEGRFGDAHLQAAIDEGGSPRTLADLRALLDQAEPSLRTRQRVVDVADAERDLTHEVAWRSFVLHSVSQWCAGYFDDGQASLGPSREGGLYASWRRYAIADRSPGLSMGATAFRSLAAALPAQADALTSAALTALGERLAKQPPRRRPRLRRLLWADRGGQRARRRRPPERPRRAERARPARDRDPGEHLVRGGAAQHNNRRSPCTTSMSSPPPTAATSRR